MKLIAVIVVKSVINIVIILLCVLYPNGRANRKVKTGTMLMKAQEYVAEVN